MSGAAKAVRVTVVPQRSEDGLRYDRYVKLEADIKRDCPPEVWRLTPHQAFALVARLQKALTNGVIRRWPDRKTLTLMIATGEVASIQEKRVNAHLADLKADELRRQAKEDERNLTKEVRAADRKTKRKKGAKRSGKKNKRSA